MTYMEELAALGVDVEDGLNRVMGDSELYESMLTMFIDAVESNPVSTQDFAAPAGDELQQLIDRVHMLKGVTGNLAIAPLFLTYTEILGLLRGGKVQEAQARFEEMLPTQKVILECIARNRTDL